MTTIINPFFYVICIHVNNKTVAPNDKRTVSNGFTTSKLHVSQLQNSQLDTKLIYIRQNLEFVGGRQPTFDEIYKFSLYLTADVL
jgi:hypothetical protein